MISACLTLGCVFVQVPHPSSLGWKTAKVAFATPAIAPSSNGRVIVMKFLSALAVLLWVLVMFLLVFESPNKEDVHYQEAYNTKLIFDPEVESLSKEDVHYQEKHDPSPSAGPEVEWLSKEDVQYQENHDPSRIFLIDGRILFMTYNNISWQEIENWKKGKFSSIRNGREADKAFLYFLNLVNIGRRTWTGHIMES